MVEMGLIERHQASAAVIRNYVAENPVSGMELLNHNGSFVFFREIETLEKNEGPVGAMGRSLTGLRSVAIDPKIVPLGAPVWVDVAGAAPLRRLMIAQDTGSAIKGAQRADLFIGTGEAAGLVAGRVNHTGQLLVLLPNALAERLLDEAEPHLAQMETSDVTDEAQEIE
jgi:membrane-bound lytic murein transglycosylase A